MGHQGKALAWAVPTEPGPIPPSLTSLSPWSPVPSGPPRKVEVEPLNSTAVHVSWKLPLPSKQHGQIRGYQVTYVRLENGEPRGPPIIQDVMLAEAQVCPGRPWGGKVVATSHSRSLEPRFASLHCLLSEGLTPRRPAV